MVAANNSATMDTGLIVITGNLQNLELAEYYRNSTSVAMKFGYIDLANQHDTGSRCLYYSARQNGDHQINDTSEK
jgi:hypothetical protein